MVNQTLPVINFIAEIGINHLGSLDLAKKHVIEAKKCGATIAKFQTYITEKRVSIDSPIYNILKACELGFDDFLELKLFCDDNNIEFSSTPFCAESADFLSEIGCKTVKVASFYLCNLNLLEQLFAESRFTTVLVSTGVSSAADVLAADALYNSINSPLKPQLIFMHCVSQYPVQNTEDFNLVNIAELARLTGKRAGYSDHTIGSFAPSIAVALGATYIEKHFTVDASLVGADHAMSADPACFSEMVQVCLRVKTALGSIRGPACFDSELAISQYRVYG